MLFLSRKTITKKILITFFAISVVLYIFLLTNSNTIKNHASHHNLEQFEIETNHSKKCLHQETNLTLIVFIRSNEMQVKRLETMLFNSLALFWPHPNSEIIIVMDHANRDESYYKDKFSSAAQRILPTNFKWSLKFTNAGNVAKLKFDWHKQLPKFWADNYTNSEYIGIVDTDTLFVTPVMLSDLFINKNPIIRGMYGCPSYPLVTEWEINVGEILGLEYIANFMDYFPVIVRRRDFAKIRNYIVQYNNLDYFDQVFKNVSTHYSEFTLFGNYLWHFEHENYHWTLEMSTQKCNQSASGDSRIVDYLQRRRLPPVSEHWPLAEKTLNSTKEMAFLTGICYADRTLWKECMKLGIAGGNDSNNNLTNAFFDKVNIFQWVFSNLAYLISLK